MYEQLPPTRPRPAPPDGWKAAPGVFGCLLGRLSRGPPTRPARWPLRPARKTIPGCSFIRSASSTSRFAAEETDMHRIGGGEGNQPPGYVGVEPHRCRCAPLP